MPVHEPARPSVPAKHPSTRFPRLRAVVPYVLAAAALLAISETLWLWHSWPVRHVLDDEQRTVGAPT